MNSKTNIPYQRLETFLTNDPLLQVYSRKCEKDKQSHLICEMEDHCKIFCPENYSQEFEIQKLGEVNKVDEHCNLLYPMELILSRLGHSTELQTRSRSEIN